MLPPITKRYDDCSTDRYFHFIFYCDSCNSKWENEQYPFSMRDAPQCNEENEEARALLWKAEHNAAYERANTEALFHFNRCPLCGKRVCDNCFSEVEDICLNCSGDKPKGEK